MYITGDNPRRSLETYVPSQTLVTQTFQSHIDRLAERGVNITFERGGDSLFWVNLLGTIIPLAIIIFVLVLPHEINVRKKLSGFHLH